MMSNIYVRWRNVNHQALYYHENKYYLCQQDTFACKQNVISLKISSMYSSPCEGNAVFASTLADLKIPASWLKLYILWSLE